MINRLISFALRFRGAVIITVLVLVAGGIWAFATINFDAFPDLTPNQVLVMTSVPGLSANEVENLISYPMETALLGLPRTEDVRTISRSAPRVESGLLERLAIVLAVQDHRAAHLVEARAQPHADLMLQ